MMPRHTIKSTQTNDTIIIPTSFFSTLAVEKSLKKIFILNAFIPHELLPRYDTSLTPYDDNNNGTSSHHFPSSSPPQALIFAYFAVKHAVALSFFYVPLLPSYVVLCYVNIECQKVHAEFFSFLFFRFISLIFYDAVIKFE